jgi:hypothetical protein
VGMTIPPIACASRIFYVLIPLNSINGDIGINEDHSINP